MEHGNTYFLEKEKHKPSIFFDESTLLYKDKIDKIKEELHVLENCQPEEYLQKYSKRICPLMVKDPVRYITALKGGLMTNIAALSTFHQLNVTKYVYIEKTFSIDKINNSTLLDICNPCSELYWYYTDVNNPDKKIKLCDNITYSYLGQKIAEDKFKLITLNHSLYDLDIDENIYFHPFSEYNLDNLSGTTDLRRSCFSLTHNIDSDNDSDTKYNVTFIAKTVNMFAYSGGCGAYIAM